MTLVTYFYFSENSYKKWPETELYIKAICHLLNIKENTLKKNPVNFCGSYDFP